MAKLDKLDKLYQTVANCEELGLELPNGVIEQINEMEEQLIKDAYRGDWILCMKNNTIL